MEQQRTQTSPRLALAVLLLVYCFNFIDRQIFAVLSPLIARDLDLSDGQMGLLKGLAFALFYAAMGIPIAQLSDRVNRTRLIAFCLLLWSAMTAVSGMVGSFFQMGLARMGVGIGEAGGTAPSHSLISDFFPKEQRAFAFGIYTLGVPIGTVFGFLCGGWLATTLGWRQTFLVLGSAGILLALIVPLVIKEPVRGASDEQPAGHAPTEPIIDKLLHLWRIRLFRLMVWSGSLNAFTGYALVMWLMEYYTRAFALDIWSASVILAVVIGIGGGLGSVGGGQLADWLSKRDAAARIKVIGWSVIASAPFILGGLWFPGAIGSAAILFCAYILIYASVGPTYAVIQTLSPASSRSVTSALYFLVQSLIGAGLGPFLVGGISEFFSGELGSIDALRMGLVITVPVSLLSGLVALRALRAGDQG